MNNAHKYEAQEEVAELRKLAELRKENAALLAELADCMERKAAVLDYIGDIGDIVDKVREEYPTSVELQWDL